MRYWIEEPVNSERVIKVPPHVVKEIREDALDAAREAVEKLAKNTWCDSLPCWGAERFLAAIDALKEKP